MAHHIHMFMKAVLGDDAAAALRKAADRSEALGTVLGARTVVGWLGLASRYGYDGEVPGLPGSYLRFAKSERGFEGEVRLGKNAYDFHGVDLPHVAAGLSVALGADQEPDEDLRDADLAALGQNIDMLLKTQVIKKTTWPDEGEEANDEAPGECPVCGSQQSEHGQCSTCDEAHESANDEGLDKAQGGTTAPGEAAPQKPPAGPVGGGFTAPRGKQQGQKRKPFGAKLTMSQASSKCTVCGETQFQADRFMGCACLRDLAKHANATSAQGGYHVEFDPEYWSRSDVALLMDIVTEGA